MKNRYYFFAYSLILISFPFVHKQFIPRPSLKKIELTSNIYSYRIKKNNFDQDINESLKRKISIGDTYLITDSFNKTFQVTPISTWKLEDLNFKIISHQLPNLIIQSSVIKKLNDNSYAVGMIKNEYFAQACLVNTNSYYFDYFQLNIPQYWDIKYWLEVIKNSIKNNLTHFNAISENCLLITSSDLKNFKKDISTINELIYFK